jgi:hypothetical protein
MKAEWDEGEGRILLGDNTGGAAVMLRRIEFRCGRVRIWSELLFMYVRTYFTTCILCQIFRNVAFLLSPNLTLLSLLGGLYLIVHVEIVSFIVYFDVRCNCPVCIIVRWYCVHGSSCLVRVVILCVLSSYLYVWWSYVFVLYWLYWCFT